MLITSTGGIFSKEMGDEGEERERPCEGESPLWRNETFSSFPTPRGGVTHVHTRDPRESAIGARRITVKRFTVTQKLLLLRCLLDFGEGPEEENPGSETRKQALEQRLLGPFCRRYLQKQMTTRKMSLAPSR
jgi:hypothetical protein